MEKKGYANLRCNWNPGCLKVYRKIVHITPEVWRNIFNGILVDKGGNNVVLLYIGAACCAQLTVSRSRVLERYLNDYEHFRQWIIDTEMTDATSGRVLEFLWHVIFGMHAV